MAWLYLALAICAEVTGTMQLRAFADGSRWTLLTLVAVAYLASFAFLSLALKQIGVGTAYAIWSGVGTAAVAVLGQALFGERVTWPAAVGIALIVTGVVLLVACGPGHGSTGVTARSDTTFESAAL